MTRYLKSNEYVFLDDDVNLITEIIIPGLANDGFILGTTHNFIDIVSLNPLQTVYTLENNHVLNKFAKLYNFKIIVLNDEIYQKKLLFHKFNIVKYLIAIKKTKVKKLGVYGNNQLACKLRLSKITKFDDYNIVINCSETLIYDKTFSNKIIFDFVNRKTGFLNLVLKDKNITYVSVEQYLGQILTKSGAKLIYDSLVRNRVNH